MPTPHVLVLTGYGINCDEETKYAFEKAGAQAKIVHVNDLIDGYDKLSNYQILAVPGGFSYGDDTGSGNALANRIRNNLWEDAKNFIAKGNLAMGICNGFQIITNLGLVPALGNNAGVRRAALTHNTSARYECRWVELLGNDSRCVFTKDITSIELPVAHGEGNFYAEPAVLEELKRNNMIVLRYAKNGKLAQQEFPYNPNGSLDDIAGICDETGLVFGLMPHPERNIDFTHHPLWTAQKEKLKNKGLPIPTEGPGLKMFRNAVEYFTR